MNRMYPATRTNSSREFEEACQNRPQMNRKHARILWNSLNINVNLIQLRISLKIRLRDGKVDQVLCKKGCLDLLQERGNSQATVLFQLVTEFDPTALVNLKRAAARISANTVHKRDESSL
jgi:hypothetical protein